MAACTSKVGFLAKGTNLLTTTVATGQELSATLLLFRSLWAKDSGVTFPLSWLNHKVCSEVPPGQALELMLSMEHGDGAPDRVGNFLLESCA